MREQKRMVDRSIRSLDREKMGMHRQEQKLILGGWTVTLLLSSVNTPMMFSLQDHVAHEYVSHNYTTLYARMQI
jgi:hypothetical protein